MPNPDVAAKSLVEIESPASVIVLRETEAWPNGKTTVGYADGHARLENAR
jgi:prepilin-type processing-associated H-X9-DG protein